MPVCQPDIEWMAFQSSLATYPCVVGHATLCHHAILTHSPNSNATQAVQIKLRWLRWQCGWLQYCKQLIRSPRALLFASLDMIIEPILYISDTHLGRVISQSNSMNIVGPLQYHELHASSGIQSTGREVATVFAHCCRFTPSKPPRPDYNTVIFKQNIFSIL